MSLIEKLSPKPKDWGLSNNDDEFVAQLVPNAPGIVAGFEQATEMTAAEIPTRGRPGMTVKISGTVQAGPEGTVDGPLSGMTCAWYRSYVMTLRHSMPIVGGSGLRPVPDIAPSDTLGMMHGGPALRPALRNQAEISTRAFRVGDRDGYVEIDPRVACVDTDVFSQNTVVHPNRVDECLLVEWVLPLAQRVTVIGTLGPDLRLLPGPDTALFVSTKTEANIIARRRGEAPTYDHRRRRLARMRRRRADSFNRAMKAGTIVLGLVVVVAVVVVLVIAGSGGF